MCSHPQQQNRTGHGMNWIRKDKRLAIYLRDGLCCCYCGATIEDGAILTLDHIVVSSQGGSNEATNLVTCCHRCNSSRGDRDLREFVEAVAQYLNHGVTAQNILRHIADCLARPLDRKAARELINRRGSWAAALKG